MVCGTSSIIVQLCQVQRHIIYNSSVVSSLAVSCTSNDYLAIITLLCGMHTGCPPTFNRSWQASY